MRTASRLATFALFLLSGCATGYHPRGFLGAGFSEQKLRPDVWLVTFDASTFTPRDLLRAYLMLRCAEVAVDNGASYFAIIRDAGSGRPRFTRPTLIDRPSFPIDEPVPEPVPRSGRSLRAAIQLLREKPDGAESIYDARELIRQLSPKTQER